MTLGLMFLMGYQFWDGAVHEWAGAGMFLLFLLHHILNGGWYRGIFRGNYPPIRVLQLAVNLLAFLAMLGLMVSGVILSSHVFAFLSIRGGMGFARILHMASAYWGFVGMALHLGLHWGMLAGMVRKALRFRPSRARRILLPILGRASRPGGFPLLSGAACPPICWCAPISSFLISASPSRCSVWTI